VAIGGNLAALALLVALAPGPLGGEPLHFALPWVPSLGLNLALFLDPLGLLMAGLILGIGVLILVYARSYLGPDEGPGRLFVSLMLFQGAMLGIALSDNVLLLVVFWELTSLTSFLLIGHRSERPESRRAARTALAVTGAGGLALLAGLLLLGGIAGSFEISEILERRELIEASPLYTPALLLILLGCFTKSAQVPFQSWLPQAMAAPTPVSAYLHSATMVKAGVFLLARLWPVLSGHDAWFPLVTAVGLVTMLVGAAAALAEDDLKGLLAQSTVSHLGLLTMLLGFGTPEAAAVAVLHLVNHAAFKAALFMNAGIVDHETGARDLRRLGGLAAAMPIAATLGLVAAASMAGLPPLGGFISKELTLKAAEEAAWGGAAWLIPALVTFGAAISVAYSLRFALGIYLGPRQPTPKAPHDPGPGLWAPPAALVAVAVLAGVAPAATIGPVVTAAAGAVAGGPAPELALQLWHGVTTALFLSLAAVAGGVVLLWAQGPLTRLPSPLPDGGRIAEAAIGALVALSRAVTRALHAPSLQRTLAVLFVVTLAAGAWAWTAGGAAAPTRAPQPAPPTALVVWAALVATTAAVVVFHRRRLLALILISVVGLGVSLAFVHLSAPDLALTQIAVEIVTILLLLLALNLMPKDSPPVDAVPRRLWHGLVALGGGAAAGLAAFAVMTQQPTSPLPAYFWANALPEAGGTNVVNLILVDFRSFDTFGEIIVLGIAALAIFALLDTSARGAAGRRLARWAEHLPLSPERHPLMLVVATRVILPLAFVTGLYLFLRGHNLPGGGFIAGLVFAIALLVQYMASGWDWAQRRRRIPDHALIAWGIAITAVSGLPAMALGLPFLTSGFQTYSLPLLGEVKLVSTIVFDVGVAMTVVGAIMLALAQLARVGQLAEPEPANRAPMDIDPSRPEPRA
jgi:multicomponent K+:H+ antiporter subunit A